jgi:hypothetical protein
LITDFRSRLETRTKRGQRSDRAFLLNVSMHVPDVMLNVENVFGIDFLDKLHGQIGGLRMHVCRNSADSPSVTGSMSVIC